MAAPHSLHVLPELMAVPLTNGMPHKPYNPDSAADYRDEVTNLLFHLGVGGDRLGDLFTQPDPEALTQAVNGNVNSADADAAFGGQIRPQGIAVATWDDRPIAETPAFGLLRGAGLI